MQFIQDERIWFREIFDDHYDYIRNYLYYLSGDMELSEDLVQDAFLKVWEQRSKIKKDTVLSLLFTIARNLYFKVHRRKALDLKLFSLLIDDRKEQSPEYILELKEFDRKLQTAISRLPEKTRAAFLLNRIDEMNYAQIADSFGVSVKAIEKHISKAKKMLFEQVGHKI
jgi:RNA polymerase sigma-70 factor (ECF subfamily)